MLHGDFLPAGGSGVITFDAQTSHTQNFDFAIVDDVIVEEDEFISISLSSQDPSVDFVNATSLLVIEDDDSEYDIKL